MIRELEQQSADDIAIQDAAQGDEPSTNTGDTDDTAEGDKATEMVEAQEEAAEERKEGGYQ